MEHELETRKFPNGGYDVTVVRKSDVLKCIDDNIIDKDIAMIIVTQCELDAIDAIRNGKIASIPHIGTIRYNEYAKINKDNKEILATAANEMDKERYLLFRKQVFEDGYKTLKYTKYFNYCVASVIRRNKTKYFKLVEKYGSNETRLHFFFAHHLKIVESKND